MTSHPARTIIIIVIIVIIITIIITQAGIAQ
jgi:hypothetical protein